MYKTKRQTRVAVIAAGYHDGIQIRKDYDTFRFRDLCRDGRDIFRMMLKRDNRMFVSVGGKRAPVIGRASRERVVPRELFFPRFFHVRARFSGISRFFRDFLRQGSCFFRKNVVF